MIIEAFGAEVPWPPAGTLEGNCFVAAAHTMLYAPSEDKWRLCHGTQIGQGNLAGLPISHAWVEVRHKGEWLVLDWSNNLRPGTAFSRDAYYQTGKIKPREVVRYTPRQAQEQMIEHKTYGPWLPRLLAEGLGLKG